MKWNLPARDSNWELWISTIDRVRQWSDERYWWITPIDWNRPKWARWSEKSIEWMSRRITIHTVPSDPAKESRFDPSGRRSNRSLSHLQWFSLCCRGIHTRSHWRSTSSFVADRTVSNGSCNDSRNGHRESTLWSNVASNRTNQRSFVNRDYRADRGSAARSRVLNNWCETIPIGWRINPEWSTMSFDSSIPRRSIWSDCATNPTEVDEKVHPEKGPCHCLWHWSHYYSSRESGSRGSSIGHARTVSAGNLIYVRCANWSKEPDRARGFVPDKNNRYRWARDSYCRYTTTVESTSRMYARWGARSMSTTTERAAENFLPDSFRRWAFWSHSVRDLHSNHRLNAVFEPRKRDVDQSRINYTEKISQIRRELHRGSESRRMKDEDSV